MEYNNNIEEDYISFLLAKRLYKAGFTQIPRVGMEATLYNKKGKPVNYTNYGVMYSGLDKGYIPRPTVQMAVKWIWVNFKLFIHIKRVNGSYIYHIITPSDMIQHTGRTLYVSEQKARERAIYYILKNQL